MPPNEASQKVESQAWDMPQIGLEDRARRSMSCGTLEAVSCSPQSQPDSGLQSSECLSEDEVEAEKTLTKQAESDDRQLSRTVKAERLSPRPQPAPYRKPSRSNSPKVPETKPGPLQQLEKIALADTEAKYWLAKLVAAIQTALGVEKFEDFQCVSEAKRLLEVTKLMAEGHQLHHFLRVFGHSASCHNTGCVKPCLMFRRVRGHLVNIDHDCAIVHVYSQLTRMHVDTCVTEKCGFPSCKGLQAYRVREKQEVLPRNFYILERENAQALGKRSSPQKKEAEKADRMSDGALAPKEAAERKLAMQTQAMKETSDTVDLSDRVSKLQMGSTPSRALASA